VQNHRAEIRCDRQDCSRDLARNHLDSDDLTALDRARTRNAPSSTTICEERSAEQAFEIFAGSGNTHGCWTKAPRRRASSQAACDPIASGHTTTSAWDPICSIIGYASEHGMVLTRQYDVNRGPWNKQRGGTPWWGPWNKPRGGKSYCRHAVTPNLPESCQRHLKLRSSSPRRHEVQRGGPSPEKREPSRIKTLCFFRSSAAPMQYPILACTISISAR